RETIVRRSLHAGTQEMRPETYARFDLHCVFNKLDYLTLKKIANLHLTKSLELVNSQGHNIDVEPGVLDHIQREGYSEKFGARPIQNAAMRIIGDVIAKEMLSNGGKPVHGSVHYDPKMNRCFLGSPTFVT